MVLENLLAFYSLSAAPQTIEAAARQVLNDALFSKYTLAQVCFHGNQCNDHNLCGGVVVISGAILAQYFHRVAAEAGHRWWWRGWPEAR